MLQEVNAKAVISWLIVALSATIVNSILGWPVNEGVLLGILVGFPSLISLSADRFAAARGERARAIQEVYEINAQHRSRMFEFYQNPNVRETLDEAGQHAYDLVDDAIERRDNADEGAV